MAGYTTETGRISNEQFVALSNRMASIELEPREIKGLLKEDLSEKVKKSNMNAKNATPSVSISTSIQELTIKERKVIDLLIGTRKRILNLKS